MSGRHFVGFTAAMAIQGLCSGYLQQGKHTLCKPLMILVPNVFAS